MNPFALAGAAGTVLAGIGWYGSWLMMHPPTKSKMETFPKDHGLDHEDFEFRNPDGDLLKGWIQAAVCFVHHRRGNFRGMYSVGTTSLGYLRQYSVNGHGLDIAGLAADLKAFMDAVERGETPPYPKQRLADTHTRETDTKETS